MQKNLTDLRASNWPWLVALLSIFVSAVRSWQSGLHLDDPFHNGEYFASAINYLSGTLVGQNPVTIHGLLDLIPAITMADWFGSAHNFLPTWLFYKCMGLVASVLLFAVALRLVRRGGFHVLAAILVALMANDLVGYRDIFLLAALYLFLLNEFRPVEQKSLWLSILLGVLLAFGLFWSFDRGIAGAVSLIIANAVGALRNKRYWLSIATFLAGTILLGQFNQVFSLSVYLDNILFLLNTSYLWRLEPSTETIALSLFALGVNLTVFGLIIFSNWAEIKKARLTPFLTAFVFFAIFMLKIGLNRPDTGHVSWALWVPSLLMLTLFGDVILHRRAIRWLLYLLAIAGVGIGVKLQWIPASLVSGLLILLALSGMENKQKLATNTGITLIVLLVAYSSFVVAKGEARGHYAWVRYLGHPPANSTVVPAGVSWAAKQLANSGADCVFDLTNSGTINGVADLPSCTRFAYLDYASPQYEPELIRALESHKPKAIVYSLNGSSMGGRFPNVYRAIANDYPSELCNNGYCIRFLKGR